MNELMNLVDWERAFHLARFMRYVELPNDLDECWMWRGTTTGGRGQFRYGNRLTYAHRVTRHLFYGESMPRHREYVYRHLCDNGLCVNPKHMKSGTQSENMRDRFNPDVDRCIELLVSLGYTIKKDMTLD